MIPFNKRTYDSTSSSRDNRIILISKEETMMDSVVGLDVSKGECQVQAFLVKGQLFRKSFSVKHTVEDFRD